MKTSLTTLKTGLVAVAGIAALSLAGCSSSVPPEQEETTAEQTSVSESVSEESSTSNEDAADENDQAEGAVPALSDYQMEGSPAEWKSVEIGGSSVDALVPLAESSAGGTIIWKGTSDLTSISFKAATPDDTKLDAPLVVKIITADNQRPVIVEVAPGQQETLSADLNKSDIVKIVWSVEGKPADGNNVAFYDFETAK